MTGPIPKGVSGCPYGSAIWLYLTLIVPLLCLFVPLAAFGIVRWSAPGGVVLGCLALTVFIRRSSTHYVSDDGVTLVQAGKTVFVPWTNVKSVEEGLFPALVFKQPQTVGRRPAGRFRFAGFDPKWRKRPTSVAIRREFDRIQGPPQ